MINFNWLAEAKNRFREEVIAQERERIRAEERDRIRTEVYEEVRATLEAEQGRRPSPSEDRGESDDVREE